MENLSEWNTKVFDFGVAKETDQPIKHTFEYLGKKQYDSHSASCGCTTGKWIDNKIHVTYKIGTIPDHVKKEKGFMSVTKRVYVNFKDGTQAELRITGKIYPGE